MTSNSRPRSGRGPCGPRPSSELRTLRDIVDDYVEHVRPRACERLAYYATQLSLDHVREVVASWRREDGTVEPHQRRVSHDAKAEAGQRIRHLKAADTESFEALFTRVQEAIGSIHGIGPLCVYDVALRIGALLGFPPAEVYLHRGSLAGARALGLDVTARSLPLSAFPAELRRLHAWEIENFLCVYKDALRRLALEKQRAA